MAGVKVNEDITMLHDQLFALLMKYQHYLTRHPVRCKDFKYWFNIATKIPNSGNSQLILLELCAHLRAYTR